MTLDALGRDRSHEDLPADFADRQRRFQAMTAAEPRRLRESARTASEGSLAAVGEVFTQPSAIVHMPFGNVPPRVVVALRLNEYVIHGHDLLPAARRPLPVPEWFIPAALPEAINLLMRLHQRSPHKGNAASFHVHRTDGEGEWLLQVADGQAVAESRHGKADVALRGPGEGLYWVLMGRGSPQEHGIEVVGDQALAVALKEWFPGP
jgi:MDMPI-like protein